jgi:pseudaminic acid synthase
MTPHKLIDVNRLGTIGNNMGKTYIIAELSANHNHNLKTAIETIKAVAKTGADAVKLQTYTADTITLDCREDDFLIKGGLWDGYNYHDLYKEAYTPWEWHEELFHVAHEEGLECFSTPFDNTAVDFLEDIGNPIYKIASFEIMDLNLVRYAASKGKPMIMSTGVATESEITEAIQACHEVGNYDITLLKCTSSYPAPIDQANIAMIPDMRDKFKVKVGLSDHSMGSLVPVVAVALGATMIEKHFILDRAMGGPDSGFSMNKEEFAMMVEEVRLAESALGNVSYALTPAMIDGRKSSRSLYVAEDMKAGDVITDKNVRSVRPGFGLAPKYLSQLLGKEVNQDLKKGTRFSLEYVN